MRCDLRRFLGALVRQAAEHARAAERWQAEAAATHETLTRVVEEHEALVARFHQLEEDFRASFLEGTLRATELEQSRADLEQSRADLEQSRANNVRLRAELGQADERLARAQESAATVSGRVADLEAQLRLIRESRTWRVRERAARALRRGSGR